MRVRYFISEGTGLLYDDQLSPLKNKTVGKEVFWAPPDCLLEVHFRHCVLKHMRGAGQPVTIDLDLDPDRDREAIRALDSKFGKGWKQTMLDEAMGARDRKVPTVWKLPKPSVGRKLVALAPGGKSAASSGNVTVAGHA
jgi:hypothetical protein